MPNGSPSVLGGITTENHQKDDQERVKTRASHHDSLSSERFHALILSPLQHVMRSLHTESLATQTRTNYEAQAHTCLTLFLPS